MKTWTRYSRQKLDDIRNIAECIPIEIFATQTQRENWLRSLRTACDKVDLRSINALLRWADEANDKLFEQDGPIKTYAAASGVLCSLEQLLTGTVQDTRLLAYRHIMDAIIAAPQDSPHICRLMRISGDILKNHTHDVIANLEKQINKNCPGADRLTMARNLMNLVKQSEQDVTIEIDPGTGG